MLCNINPGLSKIWRLFFAKQISATLETEQFGYGALFSDMHVCVCEPCDTGSHTANKSNKPPADDIPTDCAHRNKQNEPAPQILGWESKMVCFCRGKNVFFGERLPFQAFEGRSPWSTGCHFHCRGLSVEGAPGSFELYPLPDVRQFSFQWVLGKISTKVWLVETKSRRCLVPVDFPWTKSIPIANFQDANVRQRISPKIQRLSALHWFPSDAFCSDPALVIWNRVTIVCCVFTFMWWGMGRE